MEWFEKQNVLAHITGFCTVKYATRVAWEDRRHGFRGLRRLRLTKLGYYKTELSTFPNEQSA
jgi:hypothetical protein